MLTRSKSEAIAQIFGDFEPDRIGFGGFRNDLGDPQRVEMLGHVGAYQVASG
jgi:hypothetical protein